MGIFSVRDDITGLKFGKLTVLKFSHFDKHRQQHWLCECDCGCVKIVRLHDLKSGATKSCGCYKKQRTAETHTKKHLILDGLEVKECCRCKTYLKLENFHKDNIRKDGLRDICKKCVSIITKSPKYKLKNNQRLNNKYKNDINYRMKINLSSRIRKAVKNNYKTMRTVEFLGISIEEFKIYLEKLFTSEMNWENYGSYWHIDHIIPCAAFDLSNIEQQKKCFHFTNLQPLSIQDNLKKSDFLDNGIRARYL